jgi:hypothetical protein
MSATLSVCTKEEQRTVVDILRTEGMKVLIFTHVHFLSMGSVIFIFEK